MINFQKYSDEQLTSWINGTNCEIGSARYTQAMQEVDKRKSVKDIQQLEKWLHTVVESINSLKENWLKNVFWLIIVAVAVGVIVEVVGAWITSLLNIN